MAYVKFWGVRGSIPTPGPQTSRYGGNTPCLELNYDGDNFFILDAGSGIRVFGQYLMTLGKPIKSHIFISHMHWDHIQGIPFFVPAFIPGNEFVFHGTQEADLKLEDILADQMNPVNFPVQIDEMASKFIFQEMYMKWFILIFATLLAGVGFMNLRKLRETKKKSGTIVIILFMLLSVSFSGYFQFLRTYEDRTISDNEYISALWIKENIGGVGAGICNSRWTTWKISSISCLPFLTGSATDDQAYGLVDVRDFELEKLPATSEKYWMDSPYKRVKGTVSDGYWQRIMSQYHTSCGYKYIPIFNITYLVEDVRLQGLCLSHHGQVYSPFVEVVRSEKDCLYDSGDIKLWPLS